MRVLLVEDEPSAARVLAKGLREHAYAVDVASDGETALFQVSTADYDAIILDIMLPVKDRDVALTAKEYGLLEFLVRRAGDVVSRGEIAEHVWDEHYDPLSNVVDVYIQRLRRKLDAPGADSMIRTRRGEGYQLVGQSSGDRGSER